MKNLPPDVLAKWTSTNCKASFAGFTVPTTETTPWGEEGAVVERSVVVNFEMGELRETRRFARGIWNRQGHGLYLVIADGERDAGKPGLYGLSGLVRVNLEPARDKASVVHGRCLLEDEERLHTIIHSVARDEIQRFYVKAMRLQKLAAEVYFDPPADQKPFGLPDPNAVRAASPAPSP